MGNKRSIHRGVQHQQHNFARKGKKTRKFTENTLVETSKNNISDYYLIIKLKL